VAEIIHYSMNGVLIILDIVGMNPRHLMKVNCWKFRQIRRYIALF
jgi:hypothetical protein